MECLLGSRDGYGLFKYAGLFEYAVTWVTRVIAIVVSSVTEVN